MKKYAVIINPEALDGLLEIYFNLLEWTGSDQIAKEYADAIIRFCMSFESFPRRSVKREDIGPDVHMTNYKGSVRIARVSTH